MGSALVITGLRAAVMCLLPALGLPAQAMLPMDDADLSRVQGQDGLSFDLSGFSLAGDARYTYRAPGPSIASAYIGNVAMSRSDDPANAFSDPYRLDLLRGAPGEPDIISLAFPTNANGLKRWQYAFDWGVEADGQAFEGGSIVVKDAVVYGGGMQWTTPRNGDGIGFGIGLRMDIGDLLFRPRGRGDTAVAEPTGATEQMHLRGLRIGAVDTNGTFLNTPWRLADVASQQGVLNAVTDSDGNPRLHFAIDWPSAAGAALGGLQIDNISFRSDVTSTLDLGASRIGSMQIQYLDVKLRP